MTGGRSYAIAGSRHGAGATHLAVSASIALREAHPSRTVRCLLSGKDELDMLCLLPGARDDGYGDVEYRGVVFSYLSSKVTWSDFAETDVIADCGVLEPGEATRLMQLFWQAGSRMFVLGGGPWDARDLLERLGPVRPSEFESWTWCFFGASREFVALVAEYLRRTGSRIGKRFYVPYDDYFLSDRRAPCDVYRMYLFGNEGRLGKRARKGRARPAGGGEDDKDERN